ncbi:MAG TPA: PAS domain S-box protein [Stellaceae bacterium]|nr:PAS domain S-box protein [Stellaceae bacterium]
MNWVTQCSVAFQFLNNAALLGVGTLGYCELRRRLHDRLPSWAQALAYGAIFGILSVLTGLAPAASGIPASLRLAPLILATLYCGLAPGAVAALVQIVGAVYVLNDDPALSTPHLALLWFAVPAIYRLLIQSGEERPQLRDVAIVATASICATLAAIAWLWGLARFGRAFQAIGPAWIVMSAFTTVALAAIIRHVERNEALARAVEENERRFRSFYNESPVMLTAVDREERVVAASDRWLEVLGYRREEVIGRSRYDFLAPGSAARMRGRVVPALREGRKLGPVDVQFLRKDGGLVEVSAASVLRRDPVTGGEEILNFAIDQTARREAERALEERESQLRAIVENAPVGIFLKDRESRYRLMNSRFAQWTGDSAENIIGRSDLDFLPAELARPIRDADLQVLERGAVYQTERQASRPQTPGQYLLVTKFPMRDAAGAITGIAGFAVDITERRRMETALAERERDLRAIMDNAPFAIFLKDREGRYRMVNRCYTQWFGRRQEDMEGRTSAELFSGPVAAMSARADDDVHAGRVVVLERSRVSPKTTIGYMQITQFPLRDERGEIVGSAGFCTDITERNRAETALRESQELLVEAQKLGRVGHLLIDRVARRVHWSDSVFEMRGIPRRDSFSFEEALDFVHPDDRSRYEEVRDAAIVEHRDFEVELRIRQGDGSYGWEYSIGRPRYDSEGKVTALLVVLRDVTESKLAQEALARKEAELRAVMDNAPFAINLKDRQGRYVLVNRRFTEWFGYRPEELVGRTSAEVYPPEIAEISLRQDAEVLNEGRISVLERPRIAERTAVGYLQITHFPIRSETGEIVGSAGFCTDITERKRAEEALKRKEAELRAIMDNAPLAIFLKDREGRYRLVNRCYTDWFGAKPEELYGRTTAEAHPAAIAEAGAAASEEVLREGRVTVVERLPLSGRTKIGYLQITQFPVRDERGEIVGSAGFCADIGERKRAEQALSESRDLLLESQRLGKVGYILSDLARDRVQWSDSLFELRRVPRRAFFTLAETLEFLLPEDLADYMRVRDAAVAEHRDFEVDLRVRRGDGTIGWEHSVGHPRYDASGKCTGVLVVLRDITEERQAEQALRESRELLIQSQRLGKIGHLVSDRKTSRIYWSDTLFEMRGVPRREYFTLEETDATPFIHPEDSARFLATRDAGLAERRDFTVDIRVERPGGAFAWESVIGRPRYAEDGTLESVLYVLQDITERKEADEALRRKEAELRAVMDNAPMAIFLKDREGRYLLINRRYSEWMQRDAETILGRTSDEVFPPEVAAGMLKRDRDVVERGTISVGEIPTHYFSRNVGIEHALITKFPVRDESGEIVGIAGFAMDITARKRAELELRESQELLLESQRIGKIGYSVYDIPAGRVRWSDSLFEMRKLPRRTFLTPEEAREFLLPEDRAEYLRIRDAAMKAHRDFEYDARIRRGDGSTAWEHGIGHLRYDAEGNCVSILFVIQDVTETKLAAEALARKEAELRAIMDNAPFAIFLKDREGRFQLINRAYTDWFGERTEDVIGRTVAELYPPEFARQFSEADRRLLAGDPVAELEREVFQAKPGIEYVFDIKFPVRDEHGEILGIAGFTMDITARKRAETALSEAQHRLQAIMDNAPFAIFLKDRDGRYQLVNRAFTDWFGERPEDVIGRTVTDLYPEEHAWRWAATDRMIVENGSITEEERRTWQCKPEIEWVHETKFPVRDSGGAIVGVACFIADATARKRAETALSEAQHRLQTIMDNAPFAIFLKDREGHFQLVNRTYTSWFGDRLEDLMGRTGAEVFPIEQAQRWETSDRELVETGRVMEEERPVLSGRPGIDYVRSTKFPVRNEHGEIVGVAGFIADITAHERAERALRETQGQLQAIMDNAPFAIFLKDREGRYRLINRAYTDWFGDRPEDLIGRTAGEVYPAEQVQKWEPVDRELMRTGRVSQSERRVLKAKSGIEYVQTTKFPIRDAQGATIGFAGIVDDITDRKRTEIALEESRRLLLESQRIGKLAYILSDAVNDRVIWSDSLFDLRGVPQRGDFTFEEAREFIHPEDRPKYLAAREVAIAERRDFEFDVRARHGDGSWGWEHSIVHFRFDEAGNCLGSLALVQDVTERKLAEEALRHSEERFRALIEHSNDIVTVAARDGTITYRSPSSSEIMGYRDAEMLGQSIFDRVHPDDLDGIKKPFFSLIGKPALRAEGRTRLRHQDGSWRTIAWSARDASDVPGIEGIIFNSRDVTEAMQLEEQLRESQKMEAVGQLAGGIAHDFNNILGAILGFAGFLLQDLPKETPEHGFAERIVAASERGKELVRQILAFSRRAAVERKPTDLAGLLDETHELLRASLPSSTRLDMSLPEARLVSDVNAAQINQILFNLCLNANDALQGEPGRIAVELVGIEAAKADRALLGKPTAGGAADPKAGRIVFGSLRLGRAYARIGVSDTGIGMKPEVLKRIFDPFFTTKGRGRGTGLGLSVVHGIVMAYEGAILVTSRPGAGSTFHVYLPLADGLPETEARTQGLRGLGGRERVLVVDDEVVMTDVITMALDRLGYETVAINDPEEAIRVVASDPSAWDVVVSDQVMPSMKGITLVQRLKAIRPSLHCILCTGFSDGATEEGARAAGVDAFFQKPTAPEDIAAAIRKFFDTAPKASAVSRKSRRRT